MIIMPTSDNIIIKLQVEEKEKVTASGILVVGNQQGPAKPDRGEVVAVGKGRVLNSGELIASEVKEGDQVIFNRFAGTEVNTSEDKFLIIKENDILAIVK